MTEEQQYGRHWVERLLKLSDGGIHWGALEDMYLGLDPKPKGKVVEGVGYVIKDFNIEELSILKDDTETKKSKPEPPQFTYPGDAHTKGKPRTLSVTVSFDFVIYCEACDIRDHFIYDIVITDGEELHLPFKCSKCKKAATSTILRFGHVRLG